MFSPIILFVFTCNILGSFNDPFEFEGDYGDEINPTRKYVFEQVVSKGSPQEDLLHGPTLGELLPENLTSLLKEKQQTLQSENFTEKDLHGVLYFIKRYSDQKIFSFFRHCPNPLLSLDKILRDQATREGRDFDLPILSSTAQLTGQNGFDLKANLLDSLFTKEILQSANTCITLNQKNLDNFLGDYADSSDLSVFTTPAGRVCFYWMYQSLNLHLISQKEGMIEEINKVKRIFSETLGDPDRRAQIFKDRLLEANASIVFTQESDTVVSKLLSGGSGEFHSVKHQNQADGTLVFLRKDIWEPDYDIISIDDYKGSLKGRINVILATQRISKERFLLASCHGNSTRAEDGRLQITKVVEAFHKLRSFPENENLQLIIGTDANTKSEEDVKQLRAHLDSLGLVATSVGPTTIKKRMVTAQHSKSGRFAIDEEDYIITLKPDNGGLYLMTNPTVGFQEEKPDPTITLPNQDNPSDHYPVGVSFVK